MKASKQFFLKSLSAILCAVMICCVFSAVPAYAVFSRDGVQETEPLRFDRDYSVTFDHWNVTWREYTFDVLQKGVMTIKAQKSYVSRSKINEMQYQLDGIYLVSNSVTDTDAEFFVYPFAVSPGRHTLKIGPDTIFMPYSGDCTFEFRVTFQPDTCSVDLNREGYPIPVGPPCHGYAYRTTYLSGTKEKVWFDAVAGTTYRITFDEKEGMFNGLNDGENESVRYTSQKNEDGTVFWEFTADYTETYSILMTNGMRRFNEPVPFTITVEPVAVNGEHIHVVKEGALKNNGNGTHTGVCSYCGETATVPCTYRETVKLPTATSAGSSTFACVYCGYQKKDAVVVDEQSSDARQMGDIDADGKVSAADARMILRCSVSLENFDAVQLVYSDADYSGTVDASDARTALRCSVGLENVVRHDFRTTVKYSPYCTHKGYAENTCRICGKTNNMDMPQLGHAYEPADVFSQPTCTSQGLQHVICSRCSNKDTVRIPALGHAAVAATCSMPSYCSRCKKMLGMPKRHTVYGGTCSVCKQYIPRILKDLEIYLIKTSINSVGGANLAIGFGNNSSKTIKYIHFYVAPYNGVGDPVYCEITGNGQSDAYLTGPIAPGETTQIYDGHDTAVYRWDPLWYNNSIRGVTLNRVLIEYTDGSSVSYSGSDTRAAIIGYWSDKIPK